jgi:hypothetical protein
MRNTYVIVTTTTMMDDGGGGGDDEYMKFICIRMGCLKIRIPM